MNFKLYKFCQNGIITALLAYEAAFVMCIYLFHAPLWLSSILAVVFVGICFLPFFSLFYPILIAVCFVLAIIGASSTMNAFFYISIILLVIHLIRSIALLLFAARHPRESLAYDTAIQLGYKDYKDYEDHEDYEDIES